MVLAVMCVLNSSGNGGIVQYFLGLKFWEPMGKLTFGAYLIHPSILKVYYYQLTQLYQFTHVNQTILFAGTASLSYCLAMVTYVLIERPSEALVRRLMQRRKAARSPRHDRDHTYE